MPGPSRSTPRPPRFRCGRRSLALLPLLLPAAACVSQPPSRSGAAPVPAAPSRQRERVGLLLPLSGQNRQLGQSMLNAAQMALFDLGDDSFQLIPRDTKGTPGGASEAARDAIAEGAQLILGPLYSSSVGAVRPAVRPAAGMPATRVVRPT